MNPRGFDLADPYARQLTSFTSPVLARYLVAAGRLSAGDPAAAQSILESVPTFPTPEQEALWHYQLGRSTLLVGVSQHDVPACQRLMSKAAAAFRHSIRVENGTGIIGHPATSRLSEIPRLCAASR
jgi:hypothetical protein